MVHLAGENIAAGRWTAARKGRILDSRIRGTKLLSEAIAQLDRRPQVFISVSAIGYYGDRGNEILREDSPAGQGFLADVAVNGRMLPTWRHVRAFASCILASGLC